MITHKQIAVKNRWGLHARTAMAFVKLATTFDSDISVSKNDENEIVDGKDIGSLLTLCAAKGDTLNIHAVGSDSEKAIDALNELIASKFSTQN